MPRTNNITIDFVSCTEFVQKIPCEISMISPFQFVQKIPCEISMISPTVDTVVPANINFFGASVDPVENAKLFYQINYK